MQHTKKLVISRKYRSLRRLTRRKKATSTVASDYFAAFRLSLKRGKVCLGQVKGAFHI